MNLTVSLAAIGGNICTMVLVTYTLLRMMAITREARLARALAQETATQAMEAAKIAAHHAATSVIAVQAVAASVAHIETQAAKIATQTNGMSQRLEALAGEAGEGRGRAQEIAKQQEAAPLAAAALLETAAETAKEVVAEAAATAKMP
jgi:hypothetical protein